MKNALATIALVAIATGCAGAPGGSATPIIARSAAAWQTAVATDSTAPIVGGCQMFPSNDAWNTDISKYPLDPHSGAYVKALPGNLHPDFGHNPNYGIPFSVVPATQKEVPVKFLNYPSESEKGPYPIPPNAQIEGGVKSTGDRHVLVLQQGTCKLFELWRAFEIDGGSRWNAANGAVFPLDTNKLRPNGWTSADAAGLPITPALIKCDEVAAGAIDHALRVTFNETQAGYIHPATHFASSSTNPDLPPMGLRFRLKASFDISKFNRTSKIILTAMQHYGMLVADNGSNWYFQGQGGSAAKCWNDNELDQLKTVPGSAFEVVETGPILH
jgi:hypothetical protein